ncbi:L,D-transpeptidase family protein [Thiocapsa imhoffii]|nr:L,D-transpeptidase family protein [Thiocapsa imhoffii]
MNLTDQHGSTRLLLRYSRLLAMTLLVLSLSACAQLSSVASKTDLSRFLTQSEPSVEMDEADVIGDMEPPSATEEALAADASSAKPSKLYEWQGDGRPLSRILIDTDAQKARFFVDGEEVGWSTIATGLPNHPTPIGRFTVMEKVAEKRSNLYGKFVRGNQVVKSNVKVGRDPVPSGARFVGANMPYFMRLTYDGIGLHAGPIPRPGQPASHGCIRLPDALAPVLFQHVANGTEVTVVGSGPDYGDYAEQLRVAAAQRAAREAAQQRLAEQQAAAEAREAEQTSAEPAPETRDASPRRSAQTVAEQIAHNPAPTPSATPAISAQATSPRQSALSGAIVAPAPASQAAQTPISAPDPTSEHSSSQAAAPTRAADEASPSVAPEATAGIAADVPGSARTDLPVTTSASEPVAVPSATGSANDTTAATTNAAQGDQNPSPTDGAADRRAQSPSLVAPPAVTERPAPLNTPAAPASLPATSSDAAAAQQSPPETAPAAAAVVTPPAAPRSRVEAPDPVERAEPSPPPQPVSTPTPTPPRPEPVEAKRDTDSAPADPAAPSSPQARMDAPTPAVEQEG